MTIHGCPQSCSYPTVNMRQTGRQQRKRYSSKAKKKEPNAHVSPRSKQKDNFLSTWALQLYSLDYLKAVHTIDPIQKILDQTLGAQKIFSFFFFWG